MHHQVGIIASFGLVLLMNIGMGQELDRQNQTVSTTTRSGKLFPIFQIIQFPNDACAGSSSRNGTCYTLSLGCGSMSSENCTYLTQSSTTANTISPCTYTICPCDSNICRIRFDFDSFQIGDQTVGTAVNTDLVAAINNGDAIGECALDQFTLTAPGNFAPPIICGFNTGQHMIVDASDQCHIARFTLTGGAT
eukprot:maker-scaffold141_size315519-snap-gene-2.17 protein:Tk03986 transcript:maker-scaffold141_size315519-snap-gene-2.17-mRNA-1 annotation:"PREDICTED: uncharacterized protein LOC101458455"